MIADADDAPVVRLVGAGPGHIDLLTFDAETAIRGAREVVADRSLAPLLDALGAETELRASVGVIGESMTGQPDVAPVDCMAWVDDDQPAPAEVLAAVGRGPGVVRLYRGDPWFHSAGDAERAALRTGGHPFELVPGVVEELAQLGAAGIAVQVRTLAVTATFAVHHPLRSVTAGLVSDRPGATPEAPAVPVDAAHTLVVRTTDLAATARWLADRADPSGILLDRPAAAVATGPGDHRPAEAIRATVASLASLVPAGPGLVVVGLVAALDTALVRVTVAGPRPGSARGTGRKLSAGTRRTNAMAPSDRPAREIGREGEPDISRSSEPGLRSGAGR